MQDAINEFSGTPEEIKYDLFQKLSIISVFSDFQSSNVLNISNSSFFIRKGVFVKVFLFLVNPFLANVLVLYPLKTPENFWFFGVFRGIKWEQLTKMG